LYGWTFCMGGRFVEGRSVEGRLVEGRLVEGRFVVEDVSWKDILY
jgi:hypothetical protein